MARPRLFLAIAAAMDLEVCQLEIDTAFVYAPIKEDVYTRKPLGFIDGTPKVCHLKRYLYGLKRASRDVITPLWDWLVDNGWQHCISNPRIIGIFITGTAFAITAFSDTWMKFPPHAMTRVAFTRSKLN
jgi:hypothetical protein